MNKVQRFALSVVTAATLLSLVACADMSRRDRDTAVGAGTGAVAGAILTDGSAAGIVGGAIVGGFIGNEIGKRDSRYPPDQYYYDQQNNRYYHRNYQSTHRYVRCQDGVVVPAQPNACRGHREALYYW